MFLTVNLILLSGTYLLLEQAKGDMIALDNSPAQTQLPHLAVYIIYMAILHHFLGSGENGLGTKGKDFAVVVGREDRVGSELERCRCRGRPRRIHSP
jgi:hypothetical protein